MVLATASSTASTTLLMSPAGSADRLIAACRNSRTTARLRVSASTSSLSVTWESDTPAPVCFLSDFQGDNRDVVVLVIRLRMPLNRVDQRSQIFAAAAAGGLDGDCLQSFFPKLLAARRHSLGDAVGINDGP